MAEELSMPPSYIIYILINAASLVYGPENVTSGCISDLAHATDEFIECMPPTMLTTKKIRKNII